MAHLLLDAAFPPSPQQWVADMNAVGADGGFVYVYGPLTNYTSQHVATARGAGKVVLPIIVPGNSWPSFTTLLQALRGYGFAEGPVIIDLESGSLPPNTDLVSFAQFMLANGYRVDRYGNQSVLGTYSPENDDWIADWIRTGQLQPLPTLPVGWHSWQFVNDITVNGSQYDASIVSDEFIGADQVLQGNDPIVEEFRAELADIRSMLADGQRLGTSFDPNGAPTYTAEPAWNNAMMSAIKAISVPSVDVNALAAALASNQAFIQAIATAVAHVEGSALDKA